MRRSILTAFAATAMVIGAFAGGADPQGPEGKQKKKAFNPNSDQTPAPQKGKAILATDPATMKVMKDFKVDLLYSVPKDQEGSWVNLCHDPKGRLYVSDQAGKGLYRITPPKIGESTGLKIEKVKAEISGAQGLCWAFDSLYVVVNSKNSGLYKVSDKDGDDQLETVELLRKFEGGGGEHGPHAVMIHPDGKRLTVVCGNQTKLTQFDSSKPVPIWGEDHLLPRIPDGNGFMTGVLGPGGAIYNVTPDGKTWELHAVGFRNQFDAAYNRDGDLFSYDADMEWDFNTPWYRPTRVCYVPSGAEFGWRNGAGKYPAYYVDSLPGIDDIGPGSPTGVCFGYGAKFPAKFQDSFFICDWSYGKLYACQLSPEGSAYKCVHEEFVTGTPLPLTDVIINPVDGAMYFTIGGRSTQSGLYRVTYTGSESTAPVKAVNENKPIEHPAASPSAMRIGMEQYHGKKIQPEFIDTLKRNLGSEDRFIRFAARVALEHQDPQLIREVAQSVKDPQASITALLAWTRSSAFCPDHRGTEFNRGKPSPNHDTGVTILKLLNDIPFSSLTVPQQLELVRTYQVFFNRYRTYPMNEGKAATVKKLDAVYPTGNRFVDGELSQVMVYLEAPSAAAKTVKLLTEALTQEEQIEYARSLRMLKTGWTPELRKQFFEWFVKAESYKGGMSFGGFLRLIKADAVAGLPEADKIALTPIINAKPKAGATAMAPRPFVKTWKMEDLLPKLENGLASGRDFERGKKMFSAASCFGCHRFDSEGGSTGPDLTVASGRFSPRDLLESIIEPSKVISDQYAAVEIQTLDGKTITGRIINLNGDRVTLLTNMLDPSSTVDVNRRNIEEQKTSKVSMMPTGALDTLSESEVLDLMAYVLSRADRNHAMFKKK